MMQASWDYLHTARQYTKLEEVTAVLRDTHVPELCYRASLKALQQTLSGGVCTAATQQQWRQMIASFGSAGRNGASTPGAASHCRGVGGPS